MQIFPIYFLFLLTAIHCQLTVEDWFFPVSVAPPNPTDNTVYEDDIGSPENDTSNLTQQQIKDYYEKDKWEKWNNQKPNLQPIFKNSFEEVKSDNEQTSTGTYTPDPLHISSSKQFLPNSGVPKFIPTPLGSRVPLREEPVITMSMTPIKTIGLPEEITKVEFHKNDITSPNESSFPSEVSFSTGEMTTKAPYVYEIQKDSNFPPTAAEYAKMKRDVFRLRIEMNLVKALLNKLYKRAYRKNKDFVMKKAQDITRLSAVQDNNRENWNIVKKMLRRRGNVSE